MLQTFKNGQGSIVLRVKLLDSSVTTGGGLTGLTSASSGLVISTIADNEATATAYTVAASKVESITTLGTYAAPTATKVRFKEVDSTNHKGIYELHIADARFAVANAKSLLVSFSGAGNLVEADFVVQLQSDDPYVAKPANYASLVISGGGAITTVTNLTNAPTAGDLTATMKASVTTAATAATPTAAGVTGLVVGNLDVAISTRMATYAQPTGFLAATFPGTVASPTNITAGTITNLTNAPTAGDFTSAMKTSIGTAVAASAVASVTGNVGGSVASVVGLTVANLDAAISSRASAANLATLAGYVDTEIGSIQAVTDKLNSALELAGSNYRFTVAALANAPTGGGGGGGGPTAVEIANEVQTRTIAAVTVVNGLAANAVNAAALAADAVVEIQTNLATAAALATVPTAIQNADALLNRDMSVGTDSGSTTVRTPRQAFRALRNKFTTAGGTYAVYKEDDTTLSWSGPLTTDGTALPITGLDPAG